MGLYDSVYIKCEHPAGPCPNAEFQTKDLDCYMHTYEIRADRRLWKYECEWEDTPKEELPYPNKPYVGCIREVKGSGKWVDQNYHGVVNMLGDEAEYDVKFTDGVAVEFVRLDGKKEASDGTH